LLAGYSTFDQKKANFFVLDSTKLFLYINDFDGGGKEFNFKTFKRTTRKGQANVIPFFESPLKFRWTVPL
jgi:hypothetical protein